jgi:hypothetical protein
VTFGKATVQKPKPLLASTRAGCLPLLSDEERALKAQRFPIEVEIMKFACPLFVAVVLYRIIAADFGAQHLWLLDFSPLAALALCGPAIFPRRVAFLLPLSILMISDVVLNVHFGAVFVPGEMLPRYAALGLIAMLGLRLRKSRRAGAFLFASVAGSSAFYLITNTASWLTSPAYAKTLAGWGQALTIGLPAYPPTWLFFRNSLVSDVCFTAAFLLSLTLVSHIKTSVKSSSLASPLQENCCD